MTTTAHTLGELIAHNIAAHLTRLDWDYDRLAAESGLFWGDLVRFRGDASIMTMSELAAVAFAFGVSPADLARTTSVTS